MNDTTNLTPTQMALYEELSNLTAEYAGLVERMQNAATDCDLASLNVILPGMSAVRREMERLAALAQLPCPGLFGPVSNACGQPFIFEASGKKYFAISCDSLGECVEVSQAFYDAFNAEFYGKYYETAPGLKLLMDSRDNDGETFILRVAQ